MGFLRNLQQNEWEWAGPDSDRRPSARQADVLTRLDDRPTDFQCFLISFLYIDALYLRYALVPTTLFALPKYFMPCNFGIKLKSNFISVIPILASDFCWLHQLYLGIFLTMR
jgi:hypothetical protein